MMKPLFSITLFAWATALGTLPSVVAETEQNEETPAKATAEIKLKWHTNIELAKKEAALSGKSIYLVFTGSDWCPPCVELKKNVLDHPAFIKSAATKYEFLICDFPRLIELSESQMEHNKDLATKHAIQSLPTAVILDSSGKHLKTIKGYSDESYEEYLKQL